MDGYSFDNRWQKCFEPNWIEFDNFFFDNLEIADKYGFITTLDGEPIGHNCIVTRYKGNGYGEI
ncbi:hypothetical protein [Clostridium gelidum]|uniref:hypothetical protein n=1 Tax=Clostridium gelidum TaxID=704125 RepID=UPI001CC3F9BA|nr:hypothetical protein [Clostridium gelidum]